MKFIFQIEEKKSENKTKIIVLDISFFVVVFPLQIEDEWSQYDRLTEEINSLLKMNESNSSAGVNSSTQCSPFEFLDTMSSTAAVVAQPVNDIDTMDEILTDSIVVSILKM